MNRIYIGDIRGPLVPGTGIALGAAGGRGRRSRCSSGSELCPLAPSALHSAGSCPCGGVPRPL